MKKVLFVFGTRPEAIKLAPLIMKMKQEKLDLDVKICVTGQHREMLDQVLEFFNIVPHFNLRVMKQNQTLSELTSRLIVSLDSIFQKVMPDLTVVQGDTTTAFCGALVSFYHRVPVAHVEAGLRSRDKFSPFPEEINRVLISPIADYHFAPTQKAKENLVNEGVPSDKIWVVGNTVIDALFLSLDILKSRADDKFLRVFSQVDFSKKIILITGHRRENFGEPFRNVCLAIKKVVEAFPEVEVVFPVHLNPNVRKPVMEILRGNSRIHLMEPLDYPHLVWLMSRSYLVITDSGGIQEEAPSLGKPVLVTRNVTERVEGIEAGTAKLVGTEINRIFDEVGKLLTDRKAYLEMAKAVNPYGDGKASDRIIGILKLDQTYTSRGVHENSSNRR